MVGSKFFVLGLPSTIVMAFSTGLLFGLYLVTYCFANRWLLFTDEGWKVRKQFHWLLVVITNVLAVLILADTAIAIHIFKSQMVLVEGGNTPKELVNPPWHPIATCTISNGIALLTDIVLMYRLWFVYGKRMQIMWFPIFLWIGGLVCTIIQLFLQVVHIDNPNFGPYEWASVNMTVGPGIALIPFWLSTIVLNAYCTGLLIWKIWRASKEGATEGATRQLQFLVRILMESGVLYLVVGLAHFFVWFGRNGFVVALLGTINTAVVAIAFNLVLIRTAQNKADSEVFDSDGKLTTIKFGAGTMASVDFQSTTAAGSKSESIGETGMEFARNRA